MISIASSVFNAHKMGFAYKEALQNWVDFFGPNAGEITIVVNKSEDETPWLLREHAAAILDARSQVKVNVIDVDIPYTDPEFDGKAKAAAIAAATGSAVILLDCDERVNPRQRAHWARLALELERNPNFDGFLIPVVDLINDEQHYKSPIGTKVYLHRNSPNITRGVVKWAYREDGSIDKTKSDTCDAIYKDSRELIRTQSLIMGGLPDFLTMGQLESGEVAMVYHLGWIDKEQRLKQSAFWRPIWDLRDRLSQEPETTTETLEQIKGVQHALLPWRTP